MTRAIRNYFVFLQRCVRIAFVGDWRYYLWMGALSAVCLLGLNAYAKQLAHGLITTGMSDQVSWGVYIANFTFLVGVAAAAVMMVIPVYIYNNEELHDLVLLGELLGNLLHNAIEYAGRGAGRPSSAEPIRRTRQSRPISSKIASARSAQIRGTPYVPRLRAWDWRISAARAAFESCRAEGPRDRQA